MPGNRPAINTFQVLIAKFTLEIHKNALEIHKNALEIHKNALEIHKNGLEIVKFTLENAENVLEISNFRGEISEFALENRKNALEIAEFTLEIANYKVRIRLFGNRTVMIFVVEGFGGTAGTDGNVGKTMRSGFPPSSEPLESVPVVGPRGGPGGRRLGFDSGFGLFLPGISAR
jgi:hypothetical protein